MVIMTIVFAAIVLFLSSCATTHRGCDGKKKFITNMN